MPKQGLASVTLDSWADSYRCFIFPDLFLQKVGEWYLSEERRSFCRRNLNPPKVPCYSSPFSDELMAFHMDVQMGLEEVIMKQIFWQRVEQKMVHTGLLVVIWKVSLALKRHHSGTISWGWQVLVYMWAGPLSSCQRCSPLIFASICGPCCCLNVIFSELSRRCPSLLAWDQVPDSPSLQLSACILVSLLTSDISFSSFLYFKIGMLSSYWFQLRKCHHLTLWNTVQLCQWTMLE